jgi:cellulose synthase/poly-beta-1,6-N-acetylglucosamine synthase-like glycosyltransferase
MLNQTKKADEIIFVDSFSKDRTPEIIKKYKSKGIKLIQKKSNIAEARNIAIKNTRYNIIACTDASSKLDKNWLKNITNPFKDESIDVVSGGYIAVSEGGIGGYIAMVTVKPMEKWDEKTFIPSGRSVAFRKKAWKAVGGYPEKSRIGEDTAFGLKLKENGFKFKLARDAMVFWSGRNTLKKFAKQFYSYGRGDKLHGNFKKMTKNLLMVAGFWVYLLVILIGFMWVPLISFILILVPLIYLLTKGLQYFIKTKKLSALFYIPLLIFIKRISYIFGATVG